MKKKKLKWGETPWDNMTKEELLKEVWKMFSALKSANGVLYQCRDNELFRNVIFIDGRKPDFTEINEQIKKLASVHPYWGNGIGGRAISKTDQSLSITDKYDSESLHYSFFRYVDDLLFVRNQKMIGDGWAVCPKCGVMLGETTEGKSSVGEVCGFGGDQICGGIYQPLKWSDLNR